MAVVARWWPFVVPTSGVVVVSAPFCKHNRCYHRQEKEKTLIPGARVTSDSSRAPVVVVELWWLLPLSLSRL